MNDIPEFPGPGQFQSIGDEQDDAAKKLQVNFDESDAELTYANMIRLQTSPEEFTIDLAFIPNPGQLQNATLNVTNRVVLSPFNAKRLMGMLAQAVKRHEDQFGPIELDVRKRSRK